MLPRPSLSRCPSPGAPTPFPAPPTPRGSPRTQSPSQPAGTGSGTAAAGGCPRGLPPPGSGLPLLPSPSPQPRGSPLEPYVEARLRRASGAIGRTAAGGGSGAPGVCVGGVLRWRRRRLRCCRLTARRPPRKVEPGRGAGRWARRAGTEPGRPRSARRYRRAAGGGRRGAAPASPPARPPPTALPRGEPGSASRPPGGGGFVVPGAVPEGAPSPGPERAAESRQTPKKNK